MNNIFQSAYFGKPYRTRDGRRAFYYNCGTERKDVFFRHYCIIEDHEGIYEVFDDFGRLNKNQESPLDIVSEWQEEISEEELDGLANSASNELYSGFEQTKCIWKSGFKVGFRKVLEYINSNKK